MILLFIHQLRPFHHLKTGNKQTHKHSQEGLPHFIEEVVYCLSHLQPLSVPILYYYTSVMLPASSVMLMPALHFSAHSTHYIS